MLKMIIYRLYMLLIVFTIKTRKHSSRMHTTHLLNIMLWWPTDIRTGGGISSEQV